MRRKSYFLIVGFTVILLLSSCVTQFDRSLLQPSGDEVIPRLPKLILFEPETVSLGASHQLPTSSMLYTIFRRELETNILEPHGVPMGSIRIELIYDDVLQMPGWSSKNEAILEFEVSIINLDEEVVWNRTYSDELNVPDANLSSTSNFSRSAADNATATLAHVLIEQLKADLQKNHASIIESLEE